MKKPAKGKAAPAKKGVNPFAKAAPKSAVPKGATSMGKGTVVGKPAKAPMKGLPPWMVQEPMTVEKAEIKPSKKGKGGY